MIFRPQKLQRGRRGHDPALHLRCIMNCDYHGSIPSGAQLRMDHRQHSARIVSGDSPLNYNLYDEIEENYYGTSSKEENVIRHQALR